MPVQTQLIALHLVIQGLQCLKVMKQKMMTKKGDTVMGRLVRFREFRFGFVRYIFLRIQEIPSGEYNVPVCANHWFRKKWGILIFGKKMGLKVCYCVIVISGYSQ